MKKWKNFLAVLMGVCLLLGLLPAQSFAQEEQAEKTGEAVPEVTRLEWLKALTEVFQMSVTEDNYPDNYFSDISAESEDYYSVMLATEFGLVDVEAGEALRPNDAATREFAAHTLNLCMGYQMQEGAEFTFSEASEAAYPEDIQVSIDKGWLALSGGRFLPEQGITQAEKMQMLDAAAEAVAAVTLSGEEVCQYQLAEGVIEVPDNIEAELTGVNELTLYDDSVNIAVGDTFVIICEGFPVAYKAAAIIRADGATVITTEDVETEKAFVSLETQGTTQGDLSRVRAASDDVQLAYIVGGTEAQDYDDGITYYSLDEVGEQEINAVVATKTIETTDEMRTAYRMKPSDVLSLKCKVKNPKIERKASLFSQSAYLKVTVDVAFSANIKIETPVDLGMEGDLVQMPFGGVGYIRVSPEGKLSGNLSLSSANKISVGMNWSLHEGFRKITDFQKEAFTIQVSGEAKIGFKAAIGVKAGLLKAELYASAGGKASFNRTTHTDNKAPFECGHMAAHLYFTVGGSVSLDLIVFKGEFEIAQDIFNEKNSPVKVALHFEDGKPVAKCTKDKEIEEGGSGSESGGGSGTGSGAGSVKKYKYYTPINSQYAYSGINSGTTSTGQPFTVFEYSLDGENRATITKYNGNVAALNIPETIDGYTVVEIGQDVFKNNTRIQLVTMPDTVTEIGAGAFLGCSNLADVTLSRNLVKMGGYAFGDCDSLTSIMIPKSLRETTKAYYYDYIYDYHYGVFIASDNLKTITFEEGITVIPRGLFANNSSIEEIVVPDTVTEIGNNAFEECRELKRIKLSEGLTFIGEDSFMNVKGLTEIQIPDSVVEIGAGAFLGCSNLANVTLSKNLVKMGGYAFGDCDSLASITIPKSLKETTKAYYYDYIYDYHYGVFIASDNLKTITFEEGITMIPRGLFANNSSIEEIVVPDTVTEIGDNAFEECRELKRIKLSEGLTFIGKDSFMNVKGLTEIQIPDSVVEIGAGAFLGCSNLTNVTLSKNLVKMGGYAFGDCDSLASITIPKSLKETTKEYYYDYIYDYHYGVFIASDNLKTIIFEEGTTIIPTGLFANNSSIEEVTLPDTVIQIGSYAFEKCTALKRIKLSDQLSSIGSYAFQGCKSLQEIDIPNTVNSLGLYIFADCSSLARVKFPDSYPVILEGMFQNCSSLTQIDLPESYSVIQKYAFQNSGLTRIALPGNMKEIKDKAFQNCPALEEVTLGGNVTAIGSYAFYNCDSLKGVSLPDSVTSLGTYCFADCEALKSVGLGGGLTKIPAYCFNLCPSLEGVVLPYRMTTVESNAFTNCTSLTELTVPRAVTDIRSNAFSYTGKMTVYGVPGTYAEQWANAVGAVFAAQEKPATAVSLGEQEVSMNKGTTKVLSVSVTPADFTDELTWKSSNTSVATVSDTGTVTAKGGGEAVIQVNVGSLSASCRVTVLQPVTSISLNRSSYSMEAGNVCELTATVYPKDAHNKTVTWASSDESVATVDADGKVSAWKKGSAVITAKANDGSNVSKSCTITVVNNFYQCETAEALESLHPYANNCNDVWIYALPEASEIAVTFDDRTALESGFDFLYVYDASDKEIGKYTGTELSGQTIVLAGNTVKIKLAADNSGSAWGFRVAKLEAVTRTEGYAVSGTLQWPDTESMPEKVELVCEGQEPITARLSVNDGKIEYYLENVPSGTYTLRISGQNHVTREYPINVTDTNVSQDAELQLLGDVNGDGTINARDQKLLYNHLEKIALLSGYRFQVGDVNGDGTINARDKKLLYNHIERIALLW